MTIETTKNELPLISIIVPVYNVEQYIRKCLESIINQTYENLEIILVDDGTPDASGEICEEYARNDDRIRVFHKKNGGLSSARNYGIEKANGEYYAFIDSDDFVDSDYIDFLYNLICQGKYKLALCSIHVLYSNSGKVRETGDYTTRILSAKECIEMMCYHNLVDTAAYAKLGHKSLYEKVKFPEGKLFEDIATSYLLFDQCEKIICGFIPKYYYNIRNNSIVTGEFNKKKIDLIEMTDQMAAYVREKYPELSCAVLRRQGYARFSTLNQMLEVKDKDSIEIRNSIISWLKNNSRVILADERIPKRDVIAYRILNFNYVLYKIFWKIYLKIQRG